ncbi:AB hydrolase-1 domain-containing protein [Citrus sinensis]|nr:AB hydrolase-1 domain-containing protein [Citrus sinensis]
MSAISNFAASPLSQGAVHFPDRKLKFESVFGVNLRISRSYENDALRVSRLALGQSSSVAKRINVRMALVDERLARVGKDVAEPSGVLAYDLIQGTLVRWSSMMDKSIPDPPTAVLLHGILGSRKNWGTFARRLARAYPTWQFLLVDLRCHGDSTSIKKRGPHTVASTALDVLKLVWVLDATPGKVRAGGDGEDHPAELIHFLSKLPKEVISKQEVVNALIQQGFSKDVAQWVVTNLKPAASFGASSSFSWVFDLEGIAEMYQSYDETNLWKLVENLPQGVHVNFLKAERSLHRWALEDIQRIHAAEELAVDGGGGVEMHVLEDAGHWVHADNPDGLFRILTSSFEGF